MSETYIWYKHKWPKDVRKKLDYPKEPLFAMLDRAADQHGKNPYTLFEGASKTYAEIRDHADRIANFLVTRGVKKDTKVAIFLPNVPHFPAVFFGALKSGATAVTCNPSYKAGELNFQLKDSGAKVVFVLDHATFTPTCYEAIKGTDVNTVVVCSVKGFLPGAKAKLGSALGKIPKSPSYETGITFFYDDIVKKFEPKPPKVSIDPDEVALILYTGGTTGTPKGAALTHKNLVANVLQVYEWVILSPEDIKGAPPKMLPEKEVFVGALPWYHSYGLTLTLLSCTNLAGKLVCIPDPRAGKPPMTDLLKDLQEYKGTIFCCVPALYAGVVNHPDVKKYNLRSIKICASGAAPLPPELAKNFEAVTGAVIFEGYGLTETSPVTHVNPTNRKDRKFGSIGLPMPDTICKIVDIETGKKEVPIGQTGEIAVCGPQVMKGYWNKPKETEEVFRTIDGKRFFLTGDIGHMDEEGFTIISDRKKEMINVGGLKAYPREIEDILYENPKIAMAAVVGIPRSKEDMGNEYVKAFVVLKPGQTATPEEITEWAKEKLAGYKRPKEVEIVQSLPLTQVGKVLRRELRAKEMQKKGIG